MDIIQAVTLLHPGTTWNLRGDVLEQVEDGAPRVSVPSKEEIQAVIDVHSYVDLRAKAYPSLQDFADALVHQKMGDNGAALEAYLQKCIDVKNTYPKS